MFFSKTKPKAVQVAKLQGARGLPPPPSSSARRPTLGGDFLDTLTGVVDKEITDVSAVPAGKYLHFEQAGIPGTFKDSYAAISTGDKSVTCVVASDAWAVNAMFDLQRRLKDNDYSVREWKRATREVIRVLHDKHKIVKEEGDKGDTDVEKIAWDLINTAVLMGASDIHIETREGGVGQVFYRIFGERVEQPIIAASTALNVCTCLYGVHGDAQTKETAWQPTQVQNTAIEHETDRGLKVQLRFSSGPIHPAGNFHAVIRILVMDAAKAKPLEEVGYSEEQIAEIEEMLVGAQGAVVLCGPTNSGKSTSMQSFLTRIYDRRGKTIKVITVEDPVEYVVTSACQMGVPHGRKGMEDKNTGSAYTTFLKGTLRQDADVVMVGEIRDADSASAVKDLVLTGRKLLTTLHVYEALGVYARLREIGVPQSVLLMPGFISGVIYQRLVPILCPKCAIPAATAYEQGRMRPATWERVMRVTDLEKHTVLCRGPGCEHCKGIGIVGRTPCAELLVPTPEFLALMAAGDEEGARRLWLSNERLSFGGLGVTAVAHAITKMQRGEVDPVDIESQIGPIVTRHAEQPHYPADVIPIARDRDTRDFRSDLPPALRG